MYIYTSDGARSLDRIITTLYIFNRIIMIKILLNFQICPIKMSFFYSR